MPMLWTRESMQLAACSAISSKPVKQIALNCGYYKLSVFCGALKSQVGMSPMEYRRRTL